MKPEVENTGPKGEMYGECCGSCFYGRIVAGGAALECHEQPPAVGMVPVANQNAVVGAGGLSALNWIVKSVFRPVKPGEWCGRYRAKAQVVN
jgi:hypothetical protein